MRNQHILNDTHETRSAASPLDMAVYVIERLLAGSQPPLTPTCLAPIVRRPRPAVPRLPEAA